MSPQRSNLILSSNIPNIELHVLVCNSLDVESDSRDGGDVLVQAQSVEDCGLSCGIKTQHQQSHLLRSEDLAHHLGELGAHCGGCAVLAGGAGVVSCEDRQKGDRRRMW